MSIKELIQNIDAHIKTQIKISKKRKSYIEEKFNDIFNSIHWYDGEYVFQHADIKVVKGIEKKFAGYRGCVTTFRYGNVILVKRPPNKITLANKASIIWEFICEKAK